MTNNLNINNLNQINPINLEDRKEYKQLKENFFIGLPEEYKNCDAYYNLIYYIYEEGKKDK
jgi:hypothetical protein